MYLNALRTWAPKVCGSPARSPDPGTSRVDDDCGALAIEAALLLPLLMAILLGLVDVGAMVHTKVAAAAAARAAVRAGTSSSTAADDPLAVARAAMTSGLGVTTSEVAEMWVYRPVAADLAAVGPPAQCADRCVRIGMDPQGQPFIAEGAWPAEPVPSCASEPAHLGIRIVLARHSLAPGLNLPERIGAHAVMRYEPRTGRSC